MTTRRRSRAEIEIEEKLKTLDPASERYKVLLKARDFKAAWVQLGEELTRLRESKAFASWGYTSFEAYCRSELRIRSDTANRLTRSFSFLRDHAPDALDERTSRELPALEVVDMLSRARDRANVTEPELATISEEVFAEDAKPPTRHQLLKRFREIDPEAFRGTARPKVANSDATDDGALRKALILAQKLSELVDQFEDFPPDAVRGVALARDTLQEQLQAPALKSA